MSYSKDKTIPKHAKSINNNLAYIKKFNKITISSICKELNINRQNVMNGTASTENIKKVREAIQEKLNELHCGGE